MVVPATTSSEQTSRKEKKIIESTKNLAKERGSKERVAIVETSLNSARYSRPTKLLMAMERSRIPAT